MMKKAIYTLLFISVAIISFAGEGDKNVNASGGWQGNVISWSTPTFNFLIGLEREVRYHKVVELYIDVATSYETSKDGKIFSDTFWKNRSFGLGVAYKPPISKSKNSLLRWRLGADIGSNPRGFQASLDFGLELSQTFSNGIQLFILQKNDIVFWNKNHFRNGALIGIKLPLNR